MENKYLPIGTICSLKNNNKKIMIISYFSLEYNGNVKMYDYKGCVYPEGLLLPAQTVSFNHEEIEKIEYVGFKNEQYEIFNNMLNRKEEETTQYEQSAVMSNFKFDENGVVVFDGSVKEETEILENKSPVVLNSNPFITPTNYVSEENNTINDIFKFDDNGVVIDDNSTSNKGQTQSKYQFDENGFVIAEIDDTVQETKQSEEILTSNNQLDKREATTTISEPKSSNLELKSDNNPKYQFDENGIVIEEETEGKGQIENPPAEPTSNIKFDENGFVISE